MSGNDELLSDEERIFDDDEDYYYDESSEEEWALSEEDHRLFAAVGRDDTAAAATVQRALQDGANGNAVRDGTTPLMIACDEGYDHIIRILLGAGADARWRDSSGGSAIVSAFDNGHLSTVQLLFNHDNGLLESTNFLIMTPLLVAVIRQLSDVVRFLLYIGADPDNADKYGETALMYACRFDNLEIVRLLLAADVDVEARDTFQQTALHRAAFHDEIEVVRELILQHNANIFAVDNIGGTPFDAACDSGRSNACANALLELYANKLTQDHGRLALHELLKVAEYSFAKAKEFHPPLHPLRIILPLGKHKLTLTHLRTLLHTLDPELIRNRDKTGKLPIHIARQTLRWRSWP